MTAKQFLMMMKMLKSIYYVQRMQATDEPLSVYGPSGEYEMNNDELLSTADAMCQAALQWAMDENAGRAGPV